MARRRRGRARRGENRVIPVAIFLVLSIGVIFTVSYLFLNRAPEIDLATGCPRDFGVTKNSIFFLLDTTQALSATQKELIKTTVFQIVDAAQSFDRIQVFEVDPSSDSLLSPIFSACKPSPNDRAGPIVAKFKEANLGKQLDQVFHLFDYDRPTSPIIESIGSVAVRFPNDNSKKHLIIASDFVENSSLVNQYRADWRKSIEHDTKRIYDRQPRLEGIEVSMLFVPRPEIKHHDQEFADWWILFLRNSGGRVTHQEFGSRESGKYFYLDPFVPITG